ncbi:hypothetical protein GLAREA_09676 [Glarea lozoyensis ATCC 20868]|uniref:Uncharacterized protein n=1 Tax=Glarea lozoyensis (strain ATCC 20868 / MF5171) TaxID=1116229 RepID=S3CS97_GLAL2|nr:uncharacterized protein GLAREA_09676 [Glarea lozoyensis ATCC 20868]EPE28555.1 hypothetical protein GLAREA_09676 [Glarea lozoyensis ATCC 20868]
MNDEANISVITTKLVGEAEREKIEQDRNRAMASAITAQNLLRLVKDGAKAGNASTLYQNQGYGDGRSVGTSRYISERKRQRIYALDAQLNGDVEHDNSIMDSEDEEHTVAQLDEEGSFVGTSRYISDRKRYRRMYALAALLNGDVENYNRIIDAFDDAHQPEEMKMSKMKMSEMKMSEMSEEERRRVRARILRRIWREQKKMERAGEEK